MSPYFLVAKYLQFWAQPILKRWNPFVIAVTGTAGKTITLSLIQNLLTPKIPLRTTYKANSLTGIALDLLDLRQYSYTLSEWLSILVHAPLNRTKAYKELVYLCEWDSDRKGELEAQTRFIQPDLTVWTSAYPAHTENFAQTSKEALHHMIEDFGFSVERNRKLILVNGDNDLIATQLDRSPNLKGSVSLGLKPNATLTISRHTLSLTGTQLAFNLNPTIFRSLYESLQDKSWQPLDYSTLEFQLPLALISKESTYGVGLAILVALLFDVSVDEIQDKLNNWRLPPGRMSIFAGVKATTLIDSTYNASRLATEDALQVLAQIGKTKTLAVLGDMRELGAFTQSEHESLAITLARIRPQRIVLIGPAMTQFVLPMLINTGYQRDNSIFAYNHPKLAADLLTSPQFLQGGETILVKGSQNTLLLEGIVEKLLASSKDKHNLCRREDLWETKRKSLYG